MSFSLDFKNSGIRFAGVHAPLTETPPNVVICGLPRSGTTAVAAGFRNAGFDLGSGLSNVIEDQGFRGALSSQDPNRIKAYFNRRRKDIGNMPVCVKFPDAYKSIGLISLAIPGTVFLVATRDPFCVAMRNSISMFADFSIFFKKSTKEYLEMYEMVMSAGELSPVLIVSYEKLLSTPILTFSTIFSLIMPGRGNNLELAKLAASSIQLNPRDYLEESNIKPCFSIDSFPEGLSGYCFFKADPKRKVKLEVLNRDDVVAEVICDQPREILGSHHPTNLCGFNLLYEDIGVVDAKEIQVRIRGTSHRLI
ncbi:MAG: sulfotransferase [Bacteroidia bacterium]